MTDRLEVDPQVLNAAADGITRTIDSMSQIGISESGTLGRGFSLLALSPLEAGRMSVQRSMEGFAQRWEWGMRALVQAGNAIAEALGLAAGRYHVIDQYGEDALKNIVNDVIGNPHLSDNEVAAQSWSQTVATNPYNMVAHPDFSTESAAAAAEQIRQNNATIAEMTPQALANLTAASPVDIPGLPDAGWDTGMLGGNQLGGDQQ